MKPDSIILDIDGTLWNSTPIVADAWNKVIEKRADIPFRFTAHQLTQLFGRSLSAIADLAFPFLEEKDRYSLIDACCEQEHKYLYASEHNLLYPGVADTIQKLSGKYKLFIVSNCQNGYIELFLDKTGLGPYITDFECPGTSARSKGTNIRLVTERNALKNPVYVGDIQGDQIASREAGVPFCYASYGFGSVENPDYTIRQFSDLLTLFRD